MDEDKKKQGSWTWIALGIMLALLAFLFIRMWGTGGSKTDNNPIATATPTSKVLPDESYEDYVKNIKSDISYVLTSQKYSDNGIKEKETMDELFELRNKYGRFSNVIINVSYIDRDLCYNYSGYSVIVFEVVATGDNTRLDTEIKCAVALKDGEHGETDVYAHQVEVNTK